MSPPCLLACGSQSLRSCPWLTFKPQAQLTGARAEPAPRLPGTSGAARSVRGGEPYGPSLGDSFEVLQEGDGGASHLDDVHRWHPVVVVEVVVLGELYRKTEQKTLVNERRIYWGRLNVTPIKLLRDVYEFSSRNGGHKK